VLRIVKLQFEKVLGKQPCWMQHMTS